MKWSSRIYAALVQEDIPYGLKSHVFVLRMAGLWPMPDDSRYFKWFTFIFVKLALVLFIMSLFLNIFFVDSLQLAIDQIYAVSVCCAMITKACVLHWQRNTIRDLCRIHRKLVRSGGQNEEHYNRVGRMNFNIHAFATAAFIGSWISETGQTIVVDPEHRTLSSTTYYPYEFAHNRVVYLAVLFLQILGAFLVVVVIGVQETLPIVLINTGCGHMEELKRRLQTLGSEESDLILYKELIECCQRYEDSLRFDFVRFFAVYFRQRKLVQNPCLFAAT